MKVLLIGGNKSENAASILRQRFNIDVQLANTPDSITLMGSAGARVDRVMLFEQAITSDGLYIDKTSIRNRSQAIIGAVKEAFDNFDMVCIADNNVVRQSMLEEVFELKTRACVVYCKGNVISANMLATLAGKTIAELVEQYKANEVDKSIYKSVDDVKWSSEVEHSTVWDDEEIKRTNMLTKTNDNMRMNLVTGEWEEVDPETGLTPSEAAAELAKQKQNEPKKSWLFGNKKLKK